MSQLPAPQNIGGNNQENPPAAVNARLSEIVFAGLIAIVVLAPLPLGSARPLAWDIIGLGVAILLAINLATPEKNLNFLRRDLLISGILFAFVVAIAAIQMTSLTPSGWHNPVWDLAAEALDHDKHGSIAIDPHASLIGLFRLLTYAGIFYLTVTLSHPAERARLALKTIIAAGTFYAIYGLAVYWSGNKSILWFPKWAYFDDLTGPFVNHNSFATYLGLCTIAAFGRIGNYINDFNFRGSRLQKIEQLFTFMSNRTGLLLSIFLMVIALCLTHSRGGLFSALIGWTVLAVAMSLAPSLEKFRNGRWIAGGIILALLAFFISGGEIVDRLVTMGNDSNGRFAIYRDTLNAIRDYPWLGTGLGSFPVIFPIYRSSDIPLGFVNAAHDDYLENALELGMPGAVALFSILLWLVIRCAIGIWTRRRGAIYPCVGIAATCLVAAHSVVDFSLQIPGVTLTYVFLMGIAVAQSHASNAGHQLR